MIKWMLMFSKKGDKNDIGGSDAIYNMRRPDISIPDKNTTTHTSYGQGTKSSCESQNSNASSYVLPVHPVDRSNHIGR